MTPRTRRPCTPENIHRAHRLVLVAWLQDRRAQWSNGAAIQAGIDELIRGIKDNEPLKAFLHGELDDLIEEEHEYVRRALGKEPRP